MPTERSRFKKNFHVLAPILQPQPGLEFRDQSQIKVPALGGTETVLSPRPDVEAVSLLIDFLGIYKNQTAETRR